MTVLYELWINSGVRQWRGYSVAAGALFGVPSDSLIWPHFHSQATCLLFWRGRDGLGCVNTEVTKSPAKPQRTDDGAPGTFVTGDPDLKR